MFEQFVIAGRDAVVLGGPFSTVHEVREFMREYGNAHPQTRLTLYRLEVPPEMYRVIAGAVVATDEAGKAKSV